MHTYIGTCIFRNLWIVGFLIERSIAMTLLNWNVHNVLWRIRNVAYYSVLHFETLFDICLMVRESVMPLYKYCYHGCSYPYTNIVNSDVYTLIQTSLLRMFVSLYTYRYYRCSYLYAISLLWVSVSLYKSLLRMHVPLIKYSYDGCSYLYTNIIITDVRTFIHISLSRMQLSKMFVPL